MVTGWNSLVFQSLLSPRSRLWALTTVSSAHRLFALVRWSLREDAICVWVDKKRLFKQKGRAVGATGTFRLSLWRWFLSIRGRTFCILLPRRVRGASTAAAFEPSGQNVKTRLVRVAVPARKEQGRVPPSLVGAAPCAPCPGCSLSPAREALQGSSASVLF